MFFGTNKPIVVLTPTSKMTHDYRDSTFSILPSDNSYTFLKAYHGSDEALILGRLSGEAVAHKAHFGDHSLPRLLLPLAGLDDFEHLRLALSAHLGQGNLPFTLQGTRHGRHHYSIPFGNDIKTETVGAKVRCSAGQIQKYHCSSGLMDL